MHEEGKEDREHGQLDDLSCSLISLWISLRRFTVTSTPLSLPGLGTWSCVEEKGLANFTLKFTPWTFQPNQEITVMACQGTNVASVRLTLLHLYLSQIHFVHCYKPSHKTGGMTGSSSAEETGERLGSVLFSLSQILSLANPSSAKNHISKTTFLPSTATRFTWGWYLGHPPNAQICYCPCELQ